MSSVMSDLQPDIRYPGMQFEAGVMAGRLADLLRRRFADDPSPVESSLGFLDYQYGKVADDRDLERNQIELAQQRQWHGEQALDRLQQVLSLSELELDLLVLAGMAEQHEGYADIFRSLHPSSLPYPTLGLAAQLLCPAEQRDELERTLANGNLFGQQLVTLHGDVPRYARHLQLAEALWPVLEGVDTWPGQMKPDAIPTVMDGLEEWLQRNDVERAAGVLASGTPSTLVITADRVAVAWQRGLALARAANVTALPVSWPAKPDAGFVAAMRVHFLARGAVPVISLPAAEGESPKPTPCPLFDFPAPVVVCSDRGLAASAGDRPMLNLVIESLSPAALRRMWREVLPQLAPQADRLAARYPLEPAEAQQVARDMALLDNGGNLQLADVAASLRARAAMSLGGGVQLVRPVTGWEQLVLPEAQTTTLKEAVHRLDLQATVLDDWRFLAGRRGARGVRMLFAGPPGTGKTLSAEVLARALNVDLLLVDLSRVVSKWIGETEKNLAEVFETAERAKAVLFFDEAESLFGKRTEVNDSHDRYANLETAYLLSRLERFDGLAILATNLRQNIDSAFSRRLEYIIEYEEPGLQQREALWRCHLPDNAPLARDVNLRALAANYPVVGGLIRNAAVTAAFMAAGDGQVIHQHHFTHAIRREYEKVGKAFREIPQRAVQQGQH